MSYVSVFVFINPVKFLFCSSFSASVLLCLSISPVLCCMSVDKFWFLLLIVCSHRLICLLPVCFFGSCVIVVLSAVFV